MKAGGGPHIVRIHAWQCERICVRLYDTGRGRTTSAKVTRDQLSHRGAPAAIGVAEKLCWLVCMPLNITLAFNDFLLGIHDRKHAQVTVCDTMSTEMDALAGKFFDLLPGEQRFVFHPTRLPGPRTGSATVSGR